MRVLYHTLLSPAARKVRIVLREKDLDFTLKAEKTWERRPEFLALNPAGEVPVLIEPDGTVLAEASAIVSDQRNKPGIDGIELLVTQSHKCQVRGHEHSGHSDGLDRQSRADHAGRRHQQTKLADSRS